MSEFKTKHILKKAGSFLTAVSLMLFSFASLRPTNVKAENSPWLTEEEEDLGKNITIIAPAEAPAESAIDFMLSPNHNLENGDTFPDLDLDFDRDPETSNTFTITTLNDLLRFKDAVNGREAYANGDNGWMPYNFAGCTVTLANDIDLGCTSPSIERNGDDVTVSWSQNSTVKLWTPLKSFAGTFDGGGHTIRNMVICNPSISGSNTGDGTNDNTKKWENLGFFGSLSEEVIDGVTQRKTYVACISNLTVEGQIYTNDISKNVGMLAGKTEGSNYIKRISCCAAKGIIVDSRAAAENSVSAPVVGGLIGTIDNGSITDCYAGVKIKLNKTEALNEGAFVGIHDCASTHAIDYCLSTGCIYLSNGAKRYSMVGQQGEEWYCIGCYQLGDVDSYASAPITTVTEDRLNSGEIADKLNNVRTYYDKTKPSLWYQKLPDVYGETGADPYPVLRTKISNEGRVYRYEKENSESPCSYSNKPFIISELPKAVNVGDNLSAIEFSAKNILSENMSYAWTDNDELVLTRERGYTVQDTDAETTITLTVTYTEMYTEVEDYKYQDIRTTYVHPVNENDGEEEDDEAEPDEGIYKFNGKTWKMIEENGYEYYVSEDGTAGNFIVFDTVNNIWLKAKLDGKSIWCGIEHPEGVFEGESFFWVRFISKEENPEEWKEYYEKLDDAQKERANHNLYILLVGVIGNDGTPYKELSKDVSFYVQLDESWNKENLSAVFINDSTDEYVNVEFMENMEYPVGESNFVKLTLSHFSPYAIFDYIDTIVEDKANEEEVEFIQTGDTTYAVVVALSILVLVAIGLVFILRKKKNDDKK